MERNRIIPEIEQQEKQVQQERQRQENQCNAALAVSKHFEESLRRAKEKVGAFINISLFFFLNRNITKFWYCLLNNLRIFKNNSLIYLENSFKNLSPNRLFGMSLSYLYVSFEIELKLITTGKQFLLRF